MRRGTTRFGVFPRALAVMLLLAGLLGQLHPAAAQSNGGLVSATGYESPQFDFTLEWEEPWTADESGIESQSGRFDSFKLDNGSAFLNVILLFPTDEPQAYLDVLVEGATADVLDFEELGSDAGPGYLSSTLAITLDTTSGPLEAIEYIEVGEIESAEGDPGLFTATFIAAAAAFEIHWTSLAETVVRDGRDPLFRGTAAGIPAGTNRAPDDDPSNEPEDDPATGGIAGNAYTGPLTGFSVEWDDRAWDAEEIGDAESDGIRLLGDGSEIRIVTVDLPGGDVRACVVEQADVIKRAEGVSGFGRATRIEPPDTPRGAFGRLYQYEVETARGTDSFLHFIECRAIEGTTYLRIEFVTTPEIYDEELELLVEVTGTLSLEGAVTRRDEPEDDPTPEPTEEAGTTTGLGRIPGGANREEPDDDPVQGGLSGKTYTGTEFAFTAEWDDAVWTAEALEPEPGYEGVRLESPDATIYIEGIDGFGGDPAACVTRTGEGRADIEGVSRVRESTRLELPATDRDAEAAVYTYTYQASNGNTLDFAEYIECRPLEEDGAVLRVTALVAAADYNVQFPEVENVLAGIEVGAGSSSGGARGGNTGDDSGGGSGNGEFPGVTGSSYQSPRFGFTIEWNASWEVVSATDEPDGTSLLLSNGTSTALFYGGDFAREPETCVTQIAEVVERGAGVSSFNIVTNEDGEPQAGSSRTSGFGLYSLTRGGEDYFSYIYCQPASDDSFVVVLVFEMPVGDIATELVALDDILGGLEVD